MGSMVRNRGDKSMRNHGKMMGTRGNMGARDQHMGSMGVVGDSSRVVTYTEEEPFNDTTRGVVGANNVGGAGNGHLALWGAWDSARSDAGSNKGREGGVLW